MSPPVRFTIDDAERAWQAWKFNCGPAAICGVLGRTPDEIRPFMGDFERKGYTNPTLMYDTLARLRAAGLMRRYEATLVMKDRVADREPRWPLLGLVRVQWEGPWTEPGVDPRAGYRYTHWVGARQVDNAFRPVEVFDVNCMCVGGWVPLGEWTGQVVPWLLGELYPRANGRWHQTHVIELDT